VQLALLVNEEEKRWERIVLLDDDVAKHGESKLGVEVAGAFAMLEQADRDSSEVANLVTRTTRGRWAARGKIGSHGLPFASLVSPGTDTRWAELDRDVMIYSNAFIGPEACIGEASVILVGAIIGHGSRLGQCCVVASNAVLNARVEIGDGAYVGTNATILPEVKVGRWATVGAGSVVIQDVPDGATAMGVPAEIVMTSDFPPGAGAAAPQETATRTEASHVSPRGETEKILCGIWQKLLNVDSVGAEDNFIDLGGSSLLALRMNTEIQESLGVDISLRELLEMKSLSALAAAIELRQIQSADAADLSAALEDIEGLSDEEVRKLLAE